jgi:hypothetical protein
MFLKRNAKIALFASLILVFQLSILNSLQGQVADVEFLPQGKALAKTYEPRFIGCENGQAVFVEMAGRLRNKMELASYDMEQNELARLQLTDDKEVQCYGGYINGSNIDLLMSEMKDNGMRVYRERRDAQSLQPAGEALTLADFKGTQGDKMGFALGVSPNQQLLAGFFLVGRESQRGEVQVGLYNRELEEYWKMDSRCRRFDMMYVTDSGEVILGNYTDGSYNLFILDGEHEEEYTFKADATFAEIQIARYAGGKVFLVYTHSGKTNWHEPGTQIDHIGVICFNTKTKDVRVERHNIDKQDFNRLNNERDEARVRKDDYRVLYMSLNQTLEDNGGCYAMLDQTWRVTLDGVPTEFHRLGMMVCRIADDGTFDWVKTFRFSIVSDWEARHLADYRWVKTKKGPLLVWVESKNSFDSPEEKPIKDFKPLNGSGILSAMLLANDGTTTRQHYEIASKQSLLGGPHLLDDGNYLLIMRGKSRGYFGKLIINN